MKRRLGILLLAAGMLAPAQAGFNPITLRDTLRSLWQGKEFYLRGFPAKDHFKTDLTGHPLDPTGTVSWTLARMFVDHVDVKKNQITIRGPREVVVFGKDGPVFTRLERNEIEIQVALPTLSLSNAQMDALDAGLFLHTHDDLVAAVPEYWRDFLAGKKPPPVPDSSKGSNGPRPISQPEPDYNDVARQLSLSGHMRVDIMVETDGKVSHPVVVIPMGAGLDDQAIANLLQWRFQPAHAADGSPIAARAEVEFSFRISR